MFKILFRLLDMFQSFDKKIHEDSLVVIILLNNFKILLTENNIVFVKTRIFAFPYFQCILDIAF
jgi:hypothetical protein